MNTIQTNKQYNFDQAENDIFSWNTWDGTSGKTLKHKASGREIYQMRWSDTGKPVETEIKQAACNFWDELHALQKQPAPKVSEPVETEPAHGHNGYCRKCHSYCYGDCEAN